MRGNNNSIVKEANKQLILNTISGYGPITNEDIVFRTRLSRPTVVNILKELTEEGLVDKTGLSRSTGGRSAQLYEMGTGKYFSIGIDLEFPGVRIVVANLKAGIEYTKSWNFSPEETKDTVLGKLLEEVGVAIKAVCKKNEKIIGIGLGLPGLLDVRTGVSLNIERIRGWDNVDIKSLLEKEFMIPVHIRNDVHLLALINKKLHLERGGENYIYISLRSGIGMALFINGELFEGELGNAGYIGHMVLDTNGRLCECQKRGCVETFVGERAILREYLEKKPELAMEQVSFETLLDDFAHHDANAIEVVKKSCYYLGIAISNVLKLIDIPYVVINGLPEHHGGQLLKWVEEGVRSYLLEDVSKDLILYNEFLKDEERALGGALLVNEEFFSGPKLRLSPNPAISMMIDNGD